MPRPKTELTINPKIVGVRLTQELFKEWRKVGGSLWVRKMLEEHRANRLASENNLSKTVGIRSSE